MALQYHNDHHIYSNDCKNEYWQDVKSKADEYGVLHIEKEITSDILNALMPYRYGSEQDIDINNEWPNFGFRIASRFAPSLLPAEALDQIRKILSRSDRAEMALALLDAVLCYNLLFSVSCRSLDRYYIEAHNIFADLQPLRELPPVDDKTLATQLGFTEDSLFDAIPIDVFADAVRSNGSATEYQELLEIFVATGVRNNITHVCFGNRSWGHSCQWLSAKAA